MTEPIIEMHGDIPYLNMDGLERKNNPLQWQLRGKTYTRDGYGLKIPSRFMVKYQGKWRRVYITQYSNAGSAWIIVNGNRVYLY